jgi:hypothetical protein
MSNLSIDTQFIGFSEEVNLDERKTIGLNADSEPYTLSDVADGVGFGVLNPFEVITNGEIEDIDIDIRTLESLVDQFSRGLVSGDNYIQNIRHIRIRNDDNNSGSDCTEITFNGLKNAAIIFDGDDDTIPPIEIFNFPDLVYASNRIHIEDSNIREFNAPLLVKHFLFYGGGSFIRFRSCPDLETINMPLLEEGLLNIHESYPSNGLNLPSFKRVIGLSISYTLSTDLNLTSSNIPIEKFGSLNFQGFNGVESISFDTLKAAQYINDNNLILVQECNELVIEPINTLLLFI